MHLRDIVHSFGVELWQTIRDEVGGGRGLLINFNVKLLKHGIRRLIDLFRN